MDIKKILAGVNISEDLIYIINVIAGLDDYKIINDIDYYNGEKTDYLKIIFRLKEDSKADLSHLKVSINNDNLDQNYRVSLCLRDAISNINQENINNYELYFVNRIITFDYQENIFQSHGEIKQYTLHQTLVDAKVDKDLIVNNQNNNGMTMSINDEFESYGDDWLDIIPITLYLNVDRPLPTNAIMILAGMENFINMIKSSEIFKDFDFDDATPLTEKFDPLIELKRKRK